MATKGFPFNSLKAIQAAAILLGAERSWQMGYYRLLKLLYLADRKHLKNTGRPILGGHAVAMDRGPLNSAVYDLIKQNHPDAPLWGRYFHVSGRNIELLRAASNGELSKKEIQTLLEVHGAFQECDDEEVGDATHGLPEYKGSYQKGTSTPIPLSAIIEAVGLGDLKEAILEDAGEVAAMDRLFGG